MIFYGLSILILVGIGIVIVPLLKLVEPIDPVEVESYHLRRLG